MDRYEMRVYRPMVGDVFKLNSIPTQIRYTNQTNIKVGIKLYVMEGGTKMMTEEYVCKYVNYSKKMPKITFVVTGVVYESVFNKYFRWFFKYPIKSILIECIGRR
jgi:hypothetical protein